MRKWLWLGLSILGPSITMHAPSSHLRDATSRDPPATPRGDGKGEVIAAPPAVSLAPSSSHSGLGSSVPMVVGSTLRVAAPLAPLSSATMPFEKRAILAPTRSVVLISSNINGDVHTQKVVLWVDDSTLHDSHMVRGCPRFCYSLKAWRIGSLTRWRRLLLF